jgi:hopene-associated glycosyltransferase HpnB
MLALALLSLAIWVYLLLARGGFWMFRERLEQTHLPLPLGRGQGEGAELSPSPGLLAQSDLSLKGEVKALPSVVAVVPARDEAGGIARAIGSLLKQDYKGSLRVILVDDQSTDGTAEIARAAAKVLGAESKLEIVTGQDRPRGWVGKLWAMNQGVACAIGVNPPDYFLFTDADIEHSADNVSRLVAQAGASGTVLTSLMVKLRCQSFAEKLLIPAFVYFFAMLFPFAWSNNPRNKIAAAAGGCMLVKREALAAGGGLETIKSAIIDDCALAQVMKQQGPIWLGLSSDTISLRPYEGFADIGRMVWRSAYAQLGYSPLALAGTVLGMLIVYGVPAAVTIFASGPAQLAGALGWLIMAASFVPISRAYGVSPLRGILLPVVGLIYTAFTLISAVNFWTGKGGMWKGRAQAMASS